MSGALKFNFGDGVIVTIDQAANTKRGYIKLNGDMFLSTQRINRLQRLQLIRILH